MSRKCDTAKYRRQRQKEIHSRNTRKQRHLARWERRQKQRKDAELAQKVNQILDQRRPAPETVIWGEHNMIEIQHE